MSLGVYRSYLQNLSKHLKGYTVPALPADAPFRDLVPLISDINEMVYVDDFMESIGQPKLFLPTKEFLHDLLPVSVLGRLQSSAYSPELRNSILSNLGSLADPNYEIPKNVEVVPSSRDEVLQDYAFEVSTFEPESEDHLDVYEGYSGEDDEDDADVEEEDEEDNSVFDEDDEDDDFDADDEDEDDSDEDDSVFDEDDEDEDVEEDSDSEEDFEDEDNSVFDEDDPEEEEFEEDDSDAEDEDTSVYDEDDEEVDDSDEDESDEDESDEDESDEEDTSIYDEDDPEEEEEAEEEEDNSVFDEDDEDDSEEESESEEEEEDTSVYDEDDDDDASSLDGGDSSETRNYFSDMKEPEYNPQDFYDELDAFDGTNEGTPSTKPNFKDKSSASPEVNVHSSNNQAAHSGTPTVPPKPRDSNDFLASLILKADQKLTTGFKKASRVVSEVPSKLKNLTFKDGEEE